MEGKIYSLQFGETFGAGFGAAFLIVEIEIGAKSSLVSHFYYALKSVFCLFIVSFEIFIKWRIIYEIIYMKV